ncbi:uncharacterized protein LOC130443466 [Diorhabda sublineata]|uniref:uncharacterized protein LOC130443466 n=1 Tax=Diorhabda sublineata TaxID=1163346 RepID=UPI0024E1597B|nr:uncharacterized protein LOC130443466 [Diorhabda sublineata]
MGVNSLQSCKQRNNKKQERNSNRKTVVNIIDSDVEMCYSERENSERIDSVPKDEDLFFFDISGNRNTSKLLNDTLTGQSSSNVPETVSPMFSTPNVEKKRKKNSLNSSNSDRLSEQNKIVLNNDVKREKSEQKVSKLNKNKLDEEKHVVVMKKKKIKSDIEAYVDRDEKIWEKLKQSSILNGSHDLGVKVKKRDSDEKIYEENKKKKKVDYEEEAKQVDFMKKWEQKIDGNEKQILAKLYIKLPFDYIPPLHDIQRPSKPTLDETERGKQLNAKTGPYSKEEDEQIKENWTNFCKDHDLNLEPSVFYKLPKCMGRREKIKFMQYLSHKLDQRNPFYVHLRFQRLYSEKTVKLGRFTEEEDEKILKFMRDSCSNRSYQDLAVLLGRRPMAIQRRLFMLENGLNETRIEWNIDLSKRLIEGILKVTGKEKVEDLEEVSLNISQLRQLSHLLDNIPPKKLFNSWYKYVHPRLFLRETYEEIKTDLVKMMFYNKEKDYRTVNWKKYASNFSGINEYKLYELFANMVSNKVPRKKRSNLRSVVKHLLLRRTKSKALRRYVYKNGDLTVT